MQKIQGKQGGSSVEIAADFKRCLDSLVWAIEQLQGKVDPNQLERIAELIIQTMTGPWRYFHTPEHIFDVGGKVDPIEILSALFHDLVYVQVDQGVSLNISNYISPFVKEVRGQLVIREKSDLPDDPMFGIVAGTFGMVPGQAMSPFAGQNEFLSAVIAAKALEPFLTPGQIAQIAACIEATIPFRPKSAAGLTASEALYQRLGVTNTQFNLGWTEAELVDAVKRAVRLANRDVENFAFENSGNFLDNTWNLLPETNHELLNANSYTVQGYRKSLQKMEGFMNFLKPELVFQHFQDEPDEATYNALISRTKHNLEVARLYLGSKLFAMAIIEALSYRLGQDIPLSTIMGELPSSGIKVDRLENFIPDIAQAYELENSLEVEVLELLNKGRNRDSTYDLKNSPVTTFIIKSTGFSEIRQLIGKAKEFFSGAVSAETFLLECNPVVVKSIIEGVMQLFDSRKSALSEFKKEAMFS